MTIENAMRVLRGFPDRQREDNRAKAHCDILSEFRAHGTGIELARVWALVLGLSSSRRSYDFASYLCAASLSLGVNPLKLHACLGDVSHPPTAVRLRLYTLASDESSLPSHYARDLCNALNDWEGAGRSVSDSVVRFDVAVNEPLMSCATP